MIPDPTTDPTATVSLLSHLYSTGAFLCLGVLVTYLALKYASKHVAWLEVPGRAHYVTVALAVLAVFALPASQGTTPNASMLTVAFGTVMSLLLPGAPKADKTAQAGFVRGSLMVVLAAIGLSWIACGASQRQQTIGASVVVLDTANTAFIGSAAGCNGCYVQKHEQAIIAAGSNEAATATQLATFRGQVATIELAFAFAYQAAATAWAANNESAVAALATAAAAVAADISKLEGSAAQ